MLLIGEQINLFIRWVNDENIMNESPMGLFYLLDTTTNTITKVLKVHLIPSLQYLMTTKLCVCARVRKCVCGRV